MKKLDPNPNVISNASPIKKPPFFKLDPLEVALGLILVLSAGLLLYQLGTESLWLEELYSVHDALAIQLNLPELLQRLTDIRPLYYILLRFWIMGGQDDIWLRIPSVFFGLGGVFLIYRLGRQIIDKNVGLIAALLLALSPMWIYYAQMVRMYSLGSFLGLLGTLIFVRFLENPTQKRLWLWVILRVLMFWTAPLNLTLLLADIILFSIKYRRQPQRLRALCLGLVAIVMACTPSLYTLVVGALPFLKNTIATAGNSSSASGNSWSSMMAMMPEAIRKLKKFTAFPFPSTTKAMSLFAQSFTLMLIGMIGTAFYKNRNSYNRLAWLATWAFLPWLVHGLVSKSMLFDRYLFYTLPYLLILIAAGFVRIWKMHRITTTILAIIYGVMVTAGLMRYYGVQDRPDFRSLAATLSQHDQPGDVVAISFGNYKVPNALRHYYKGEANLILAKGVCTLSKTNHTVVNDDLSELPPISNNLWLVCGSGFDRDVFQEVYGDRLSVNAHWQFVNEAFYREEDYMHLFQVTLK